MSYIIIGILTASFILVSVGGVLVWWWIDTNKYVGKEGTVYLGYKIDDKKRVKDEHKAPKNLYLTQKARRQHTHFKGITQVGKSTAMANVMMQDMADDLPVIYFDFKTDLSGIAPIVQYAQNNNQTDKLHYTAMNMGEELQNVSMLTNPLSQCFESGETNRPEAAIKMLQNCISNYLGESQYYREEAQQMLERFVYAAAYTGKKINMRDIALSMNQKRVREAVLEMAKKRLVNTPNVDQDKLNTLAEIRRTEDHLPDQDDDKWYELTNRAASHVASLTRGDLGRHLNTYTPDVSVNDIIENSGVWLIQIPAQDDPRKSVFLYNMILNSIQRKIKNLRTFNRNKHLGVFVDDFPFAMSSVLTEHLRQAGGSGVVFHISTQKETAEEIPGVEDSQAQSKEFYNLIGNKIIFKTSDQDTIKNFTQKQIPVEIERTIDGEKQTKQDTLLKPHSFDNGPGEAIVSVELNDDYPSWFGYRGRGFPAVGKYKLKHPNLCQKDIDNKARKDIINTLEKRKRTISANRKIRAKKESTMNLTKRFKGEDDNWLNQ